MLVASQNLDLALRVSEFAVSGNRSTTLLASSPLGGAAAGGSRASMSGAAAAVVASRVLASTAQGPKNKAAFKKFQTERMEELRAMHPTMSLKQVRAIVSQEWDKHPLNPRAIAGE